MRATTLAPLRHRSFALGLSSSFVSSTGSWMQTVALGVYLTETTHDALWLGLLTVAAWAPSLLGSPLGGLAADRWRRPRFIQATNLVMAASASVLAGLALAGDLTPATAVTLAVVEGLFSSASWPAWQSLLPDLVERDEVLAAVSLSSAQFNLGRIIGPLLAGVALALGSPAACFAANAASYVVVVVMFAFVRAPHRGRPDGPARPWADLVEGARAAWASPGCRYPILAIALVALTVSPFIALVPAMAITVLHAGRVGTSWLVTAQGIGAVVGAVTLPALARRTSRQRVLRLSLVGAAACEALYGLSPDLGTALAALALLGAAYVGVLTGLNTSVQLHAPVRERSRVLSLYTLSLSIAYPVGALAQSALARVDGVRAVTVAGALAAGAALCAVALATPRVWAEIGAAPPAPTGLLAD